MIIIISFLPCPLLAQDSTTVRRAVCNFTPNKLPETILDFCESSSEKYRKLIAKMFAYSGQVGMPLFVGNSTSYDLRFACAGFNANNCPSIVINEANLELLHQNAIISIIAHEMGHFNNRDIDTTATTSQMELNADFYSGFWCARNKIDDIENILLPYTMLADDYDSIHPSKEKRIQQVKKGYEFAQTSFGYQNSQQNSQYMTRMLVSARQFSIYSKLLKKKLGPKFQKGVGEDAQFVVSNGINPFEVLMIVDPNFILDSGNKKYKVHFSIINTAQKDILIDKADPSSTQKNLSYQGMTYRSDSYQLSSVSKMTFTLIEPKYMRLQFYYAEEQEYYIDVSDLYGECHMSLDVEMSDGSRQQSSYTISLPN